jgi:hypothetical protein
LPAFELLHVEHGEDRGRIGSAWYTFRKTYEALRAEPRRFEGA